jgi:3-methylfumaryl-CoA hydratase
LRPIARHEHFKWRAILPARRMGLAASSRKAEASIMTALEPEIDIAHLRQWIGREERSLHHISEDLVRKFNATLNVDAPEPKAGMEAPGLFHYCMASPIVATAELAADGHPHKGGLLPPVSLPRRMWAGSDVTFHGQLKVGDVVHRVTRIADVAAKQGKTGALVFVTVEHVLDVRGVMAIVEKQDIVYRGADTGQAGQQAAAMASAHRQAVAPDPALLFRYSALTFNAHRIHYDRSYATDVEGYPALVVHGPLQATLLFNHAVALWGSRPTRFAFRSRAPLFDSEPFFLDAERTGSHMKLWTSRAGGPIAMFAEAEWP